jgi:hypothetical protein
VGLTGIAGRRHTHKEGYATYIKGYWRLQHRFSFWVKQCRPQVMDYS